MAENPNASSPSILYHLAPVPRWRAAAASAAEGGEGLYFPETYAQDGFTHLTADPSFLIAVGNSFYRDSTEDWLLLELDAAKLGGEVRYEPAAPVGDTQPSEELKAKQGGSGGGGEEEKEKEEEKQEEATKEPPPATAVLFPHLYGGIPTRGGAVIREKKVTRGEDGSFLSIEGM